MSYINCLMPKPIPCDSEFIDSLSATMSSLKLIMPNSIPVEYRLKLSEFIEITSYILISESCNRGMLKPLVTFGESVIDNPHFVPWVCITPHVNVWLPIACRRFSGEANDDIDQLSMSVDLATKLLPRLAEKHSSIKRQNYHEPLPIEICAWLVYCEVNGYNVFAIPSEHNITNINLISNLGHLEMTPLNEVLDLGWDLEGGFIKIRKNDN